MSRRSLPLEAVLSGHGLKAAEMRAQFDQGLEQMKTFLRRYLER